MNGTMVKALLCGAMVVACEPLASAQCAEQWAVAPESVMIEGDPTDGIGFPFRVGNELYSTAWHPLKSVYGVPIGDGVYKIVDDDDDEVTPQTPRFRYLWLVRWDETSSAWNVVPGSRMFQFGGSFNIQSNDAAVLGGGLFLGGQFYGIEHYDSVSGEINITPSRSIARWDLATAKWDNQWSLDHKGLFTGFADIPIVYDMLVHDGSLYILGNFAFHFGEGESGSPPATQPKQFAFCLTSFSDAVWRGDVTPEMGAEGPDGTGWVRVTGGRNFVPKVASTMGGMPLPEMLATARMAMFPDDQGEDVLHVAGVTYSYWNGMQEDPTAAPGLALPTSSVHSYPFYVVRQADSGPQGFWEVLSEGVFSHIDTDDPFDRYSAPPFLPLHTVIINSEPALLLGGGFNWRNGSETDDRLLAWNGNDWSQFAHVARSGSPYGVSLAQVRSIVARRVAGANDEEVVFGGAFELASMPLASTLTPVKNMAGIRSDAIVVYSNSGGTIPGAESWAGREGLNPFFEVFNRIFVFASKTDALPNNGFKLNVWGRPLSDLHCEGDLNDDGQVNFSDLNILLAQFGMAGVGLSGDINGDGVVGFADMNELLSLYGTPCC